eukprot:TRINITY_DN587_c0_g1_i8.p1 TRINITY_DN587_c0_g1~~TRINITY_DN587_c0_g1_i8.p1  ORF type:complete len:720 (-),score=36.19 TRINITY_DN587_c0_g1_i8:126-1994(-)
MIQLMNDTDDEIGFMIRCQYATDELTCTGMQPGTCVWEEGECHIRISYLVDTMLGCADQSSWKSWTENDNLQCEQYLVNTGKNFTWLNNKDEKQVVSTACEKAHQNDFFSLNDEHNTCNLLDDIYNCRYGQFSTYCSNVNTHHTIGQQLLSVSMQLLYGFNGITKPIDIQMLEDVLNIKRDTLQAFGDCKQYSPESDCKDMYSPPSPQSNPPPKVESAKACREDDADLTTCIFNPQSLIELLSNTDDEIGYMIRCQYATNKTTCMDMQPDTCVWKQGKCHISAPYLVNTLLGCVDSYLWDNWYKKDNEHCYRELQSIGTNDSYIDKGHSTQTSSACKYAYYTNFFSLDAKSEKCRYIRDTYKCSKNDSIWQWYSSSQTCTKYGSEDTIGQQLFSAVRFLLYNDTSLNYAFSWVDLEDVLRIQQGNLQQYGECADYHPRCECESAFCTSSRQKDTKWKGGMYGSIGAVGSAMILLVSCVFCCYGCCHVEPRGVTSTRANNHQSNHQNVATRRRNNNRNNNVVASNASTSAQTNRRSIEMTNVTTKRIINALPVTKLQKKQGECKSETVCAICIQGIEYGEQITIFPCAHQFHLQCARKWIDTKGKKTVCPLCKYELANAVRQN